MEDTDRHWKLWGELNPQRGNCYRHVSDDQFWLSGQLYTSWILQQLSGLYPSSEHCTALDFGCGVGRILKPLSLRYEHVTGVDVSPAMLKHAHRNVPNAELLEHIPSGRRFDLVHSYLVLQHIPVHRGLDIVNQLRQCVAPGGLLALHVPLQVHHSLIYRIKHAIPASRFLFNLLQGKPLREPLMQANAYPLTRMCEILDPVRIIPHIANSVFFCGNY